MTTEQHTEPKIQDVNVAATIPLVSPTDLVRSLPLSDAATSTVVEGRRTIVRILKGEDPRLLAIVGPCSIHDPQAAMDYARRIADMRAKVGDVIEVAMRVYFEKPRTTLGWKGLINDPHLDGSFDMAAGLRIARQLLLAINELGVPAATEVLDPITPQYLADLIAWSAIGARTTESQTHRQMASGLSMPVGFKNATSGDVEIAIQAMQAARSAHSFLGVDSDGRTCIVRTKGNPWGHLILRGGPGKTNFDPQTVASAVEALRKFNLPSGVMVDCSHANAAKKYERQEIGWNHCVQRRREGDHAVIGLMLESNLEEGAQKLTDPKSLRYGVSITDECIGWRKTEELLLTAAAALR